MVSASCVEERLVIDPADMLFVADDRQMADEALDLSFEFAKADAALLPHRRAALRLLRARLARPPVPRNSRPARRKSEAEIKAAQDQLKVLQDQLAGATQKKRRDLDAANCRRARANSISRRRAAKRCRPSCNSKAAIFIRRAIRARPVSPGAIEELEKSIPEAERNAKPPAASEPTPPRLGRRPGRHLRGFADAEAQ